MNNSTQSVSFSDMNLLGALLLIKKTVKQNNSTQSVSFSDMNLLGALLLIKKTVK